MPNLLDSLIQRLGNGLDRASIQSASSWAQKYRMMGNPFPGLYNFKHHPWAKEMHDSKAHKNVGMKAAQMGFTEVALNVAFYTIDVLKQDVLYVLPNKSPDATDFSSSRFDSALSLSEHLTDLFSDVKNVGLKRSGACNFYIRGSQSRVGLKSVPAAKIFLDELAEMNQKNVALALERQSGQKIEDKMTWMLSTPTLEKHGIHNHWSDSSQEYFFFPCPSCSRLTSLIWPECIEITAEDVNDPRLKDSYLKCHDCKSRLHHQDKPNFLAKGVWVPTFPGRDSRGFHVSQLYSSTITAADLAFSYLTSLKDPTAEQELYNSKLGLCHVVKGAQITDSNLKDCEKAYTIFQDGYESNSLITMGVDVGKKLHIEITEWQIDPTSPDVNSSSEAKIIFSGTRNDFEDLDLLIHRFGVMFTVIDANPETRKARELASRHYGRVALCYYGNSIKGRYCHYQEEQMTVTVDRTAWLDQSLGRFKNKTIIYPCDISEEFKAHIKAQVKRYDIDKDGNPISRYITAGDEDHYGHARNYSEIALPLATTIGRSQNMRSPV